MTAAIFIEPGLDTLRLVAGALSVVELPDDALGLTPPFTAGVVMGSWVDSGVMTRQALTIVEAQTGWRFYRGTHNEDDGTVRPFVETGIPPDGALTNRLLGEHVVMEATVTELDRQGQSWFWTLTDVVEIPEDAQVAEPIPENIKVWLP